jgi:ADP-heptose:LPS heptosyltransferase
MNVQALVKVDRWLGVPLCFLLSAFRRLVGRRQPDCSAPPRNLLFVKLAEQGATVLAVPAIRRAVELVGRENVYFLVLKENRFILDVLNLIPASNVITICSDSPWAFATTGLAALARLRRLRLDAAVDMEFFSRGSASVMFLTGAKRRAGFHGFGNGSGPYRGDLLTHRLLYNPHLHTVQTFLSLVEALLLEPASLPTYGRPLPDVPEEPPVFKPSTGELDSVQTLLTQQFGQLPPLFLLNANASDLLPLRRWPTERYIDLARRLLARFPEACIGFTGAPNEAPAAAEIVRQLGSKRAACLAGKTTLRQLLVLYSLADVLVTNDSGPAHFATLTPIRVVTLFGPETPALFGAQTSRNTILWAGLPCSPCVNAYNNRQSVCRNNLCMQAITVDQVFKAASDAYAARRSERLTPLSVPAPA